MLQLLADASGQNIVVSDTVSGSVTLRLQNVPWDQALDIVLRTKGLDKRQDGNVIIVAPAEELASREKAELAAHARTSRSSSRCAPSTCRSTTPRRRTSPALHQGGTGGNPCCPRAAVSRSMSAPTRCCSRTRPSASPMCAGWWPRSTSRSSQVQIEARVVIVNNDFERELGAVLGVTPARISNGTNGLIETTGTAAGTDQGVSSAITNLTTTGSVYPVTVPTGTTASNRYNVNLPVSSPAGSIALGILGADYLVDLELSAAQTESRGDRHLLPARDHRQPAGGDDQAGHGDPVPAVGLERRDHDLVQGCGAAR